VSLLHPLPLRAVTVENFQQHRVLELLGGGARASALKAGLSHAGKPSVQARLHLVYHLAHRARQVFGRDEILLLPDAG